MKFAATTCAACGAKCTDHLSINRDGPGLGPVVALCESCLPCGRPVEKTWRAIAKRMAAKRMISPRVSSTRGDLGAETLRRELLAFEPPDGGRGESSEPARDETDDEKEPDHA